MPDAVIEAHTAPAEAQQKPVKFQFTPANARRMAELSAERRRQRKQERLDAALTPVPEPAKPLAKPPPELELVEEQIARAREVLNDRDDHFCPACERGGLEPHHRAQLLKALDSLLDRKRILLGIPGPGSRRPAPDKTPSGRSASLLLGGDTGPSQGQVEQE